MQQKYCAVVNLSFSFQKHLIQIVLLSLLENNIW